MNDNKKQAIDEIAKLICTYPQCVNYNIIGECVKNECITVDSAETLYNAGYRRQSEVAKSIEKQQKIYNETMERLCRMGKKKHFDVIVALAEEIERYRDKIRSMDEFINKHEEKWISVDERLPVNIGSYLVVVKLKYPWKKEWEYDVDAAVYNPLENGYIDHWNTWNDWNEGQECHITHWMPLPELPKMKGGAE